MADQTARRWAVICRSLNQIDIRGLRPGQHVVVLSRNPVEGLTGRRLDLELRDTLAMLSYTGTEFAFLFRNKLEGTVAENVLKHGMGGLWIDGCRLSLRVDEDPEVLSQRSGGKRGFGRDGFVGSDNENRPLTAGWDVSKGRWPTNLVLIHGPECRQSGTKKVQSQNPVVKSTSASNLFATVSMRPEGMALGYANEDGTETVAAWDCQEGCPVADLDRQSGNLPTQKSRSNPDAPTSQGLGLFGQASKQKNGPEYFGESGGASRFFPQFADVVEFEGWVGRLLDGPEDNQ